MRRRFTVILALVFALMSSASASSGSDTVAISGRVFDQAKGNTLAGTSVVIYDPAGSVRRLATDANGRYHAIGLGSGVVKTWVYREGYLDGRQDCTVHPGDSLRVDFGLITQMKTIGTQRFNCEVEPDPIDRTTVP